MRGYSLFETLVSVFIFSLLALAMAGIFNASQESIDWNYQELALQKELRRTLAAMTQEIRESSPSSPVPITIGTNTLSFQIPSSISANLVTGWTLVSYGLGSNATATRTANGQTTTLGSDIQALNFIYPVNAQTSPRTVQIQITGSRNTLKRNITLTLTGQVTLRNQ